MKQGRPDRRA